MEPTGRPGGIRLEDVSVTFAATAALRGVDLTIDAGTGVAVTGPSGSGKSTLCLVLAGLLSPSSGRVLVNGSELSAARRGDIGFVPQSHGLVSGLTAAETVALPLQARRLERDEISERTSAALASVGLADHASRLVDQLSGGERQRVAIARALAGDPTVLIGDEPTAELDPDNRERVLNLFRDRIGRGRIVVIATDDAEVQGSFSRVVELDEGSIVVNATDF
jgi:putative ABC transport system ATP-binding protein